MERVYNKSKKYDTVSLFAGIGGFDIALSNAGFDMIWANDFDKYALYILDDMQITFEEEKED